jgi:protocatechuate 3,4-dioxygenase alpha subunit
MRLTCRVLDGDDLPVNDAMIEIWQADSEGKFNHPADSRLERADPACRGFGRLATNEVGVCTFDTVRPGRIPGHSSTLQAPHFNLSIFARGILKRLATRVYFAGHPANAEDPILALVPDLRRHTLMARSVNDPNDFHFDVRLCGEDETVFFDV